MKSNLISRAWLSLERAYQRAHHSQLYQLKLFSAHANSIGNPEPPQISTEVSNDQWICFQCGRLKPPNKYTCVSSICLLLSEPLKCAKVRVSRYFHHQKIQAPFLWKRRSVRRGGTKQTALNTVNKIWRVGNKMQRPYLLLAHAEDCSLYKMTSPPYLKSRSYFQSRSCSQWQLLRLANVHRRVGLGPPGLFKSMTAQGRAQTAPREWWVFLRCLNPAVHVARAQQFRAGHTPAFFCNQKNCSSPSISQFLLLGLVTRNQSCHSHMKQSAGPAWAQICWWVNSVLWSFTSDTIYLHPSYFVPSEIHNSEAVVFSLGLFFPS